jgi:hypothetical protein
VDLARLQFASTSIDHFLFVPVTIGLAFLVALLHTAWFVLDADCKAHELDNAPRVGDHLLARLT